MKTQKAKTKPPTPKWKLILAGIGAAYGVVFVVFIAHAALAGPTQSGPSELALHPDKQDEILSGRTADKLQDQLGLSEEQRAHVATVIAEARKESKGFLQEHKGEDILARRAAAMAHMQEVQSRVEACLTPEQQAKYQDLKADRMQRITDVIGAVQGRYGNRIAAAQSEPER